MVGAIAWTFFNFTIFAGVLGFAVACIIDTSTVVRAGVSAEAVSTSRARPALVTFTEGVFAKGITNTLTVEVAIAWDAPNFAAVVADVARMALTFTGVTITYTSAGAVFGAV